MIYQIFPEFVDEIPENICEGYLYVCMQYDGETVTLSPSIGNGSYKCKSHYFIRGNNIVLCEKIKNVKSVYNIGDGGILFV